MKQKDVCSNFVECTNKQRCETKKERKTNLRKINWRETKEAKRGAGDFHFLGGAGQIKGCTQQLERRARDGKKERNAMKWTDIIKTRKATANTYF